LRSDPKTQGPKLFRQHCAACHSHAPADNGTSDPSQVVVAEKPSAPNLWGIGTRNWVRRLLDPKQIAGPELFGNTSHKEGDMVTFVNDTIATKLDELQGEELTAYKKKIEDVTFTLANEAGLIREMAPDIPARVAAGREAMINEFTCVECHKFGDDGELGMAPDLTGYASREWLAAFMRDPEHERFYPETNDRMPAFAPNAENPLVNRLGAEDVSLLVSWLRGEWYEPTMPNPPVNAGADE
jgi:ubiquinol-cytochrome c reductase cytochrome b subunit